MLHGQQCVHLRRIKPEPGQSVAVGLFGVRFVTLAARLMVPGNGCRQAIAHVFQVAPHGGPRYFHCLHHLAQSGALVGPQHAVDGVEALGSIQKSISPQPAESYKVSLRAAMIRSLR